MYYTYILKLSNGNKYIGHAEDLKERIKDHNQGSVFSTKKFKPMTLIFYAAFTNKKKAIEFEKYLKSSSGTAFRNKRLL